jgi:hypothetical protein
MFGRGGSRHSQSNRTNTCGRVLRYVERNPLRAGLVARPEDWPWSSLPVWLKPPLMPWLDPGPAPRHPHWQEYVAAPQTEAELEALRRCVARGTPYGSSGWVRQTATDLGLESSLNPPGRPHKRTPSAEQDGLFGDNEPGMSPCPPKSLVLCGFSHAHPKCGGHAT